MGCGGSKDVKDTSKPELVNLKGVDAPLNHKMKKLDEPTLDETFKKAGELIEKLEGIRTRVIDNRDEVELKSGLCTRKGSNARDYYIGILVKLAVDANANVESIDFKLHENKIKLGQGKFSAEGKAAAEAFASWVDSIFAIHNEIKEIDDVLTKFTQDFNTEKNNIHFETLKKVHDNKQKEDLLKINLERIKIAIDAAHVLVGIHAHEITDINKISEFLNSKEMIKSANSTKDKAIEAKVTDPLVIAFNYINHLGKDKVGHSHEDGKKELMDKQRTRIHLKKVITDER